MNNNAIDNSGIQTISICHNWQGVAYQWNEKNGKTYRYSAILEKSPQDIYLDTNTSILFKKCAALLILRPLHTVIKTLYHFTLIGVGVEIWYTLIWTWFRNNQFPTTS